MSRMRWDWDKVEIGQIISFLYGEGTSRSKRTVLVMMDPTNPLVWYRRKYDNRTVKLLHGLQLEVNNIRTIPKVTVSQILERIAVGKTLLQEFNSVNYYSVDIRNPKMAYNRIENIIKHNNIYRTYNLRKAKRTPVYLEDYQLPSILK